MQTKGVSKENYRQPPRTAMEVFEMLPEGTLAEVINNTIYMAPAPTFEHQDFLGDLFTDINTFVRSNKLGKCVFSPIDVYLGERNALQPDIIFITREHLDIIKNGKVKGAPDLIVEVLSTNRNHDLEVKKKIYEAFNVREYFIVDPVTKQVITYYHNDEKFVEQETKKGKIKSKILKKTFSF